MESCSVGSILNSKCRAGKNILISKSMLMSYHLVKLSCYIFDEKNEPFTDVVDLCP